MSRTTRLNKALTVALYSECDTMTIETRVTNEKEYDNISDFCESSYRAYTSCLKLYDATVPENMVR